ncbi:MAG: bis(5'-nucleosyl)-tetraphosphatase (symmetrical) YqeK [Oscillospiraceae bacterium]|nr:bis(5'-nucleosyl)-tetraphosphatase (symmetrical) YqeK [Oscillospiraceae bacterium]
MTEKEIEQRVKSVMSEKRYLHTIGCVDMAERLAGRWGADVALARRAALLHDIAKEMPYDKQLSLVDEHGIILNRVQRSEKIIQAFSGAIIAWREFDEPEEVCGAIRWHTTAKSGMTLLEKIIWLADLTEEGRSFDGVCEIRRLAFEDLSRALISGFDTTLRVLISRGCEIDSNMVKARNFEIAANS